MNRFFAIYKTANGEITKTQSCSDEWDPLQTGIKISLLVGEDYLEVPWGADYTTGIIVNGEYVPHDTPPVVFKDGTATAAAIG